MVDPDQSTRIVHPEVLAVALALLANPEAVKQATRLIERECHIQTDPARKIAEWSVGIVRELQNAQKQL